MCVSLTETQKKIVSVKESCFCDINLFVKEISFCFFVSISCFPYENTLFWDIIHDFQGEVSVRNGSICYLG